MSNEENLAIIESGAYYSSEVGMRELGWTSDYAFAAFPAARIQTATTKKRANP